MVFISYS